MVVCVCNAIREKDVREAARTTFDTTVVMEAGAGTGKTAVLVTRTGFST